jgi:UrcA family protein
MNTSKEGRFGSIARTLLAASVVILAFGTEARATGSIDGRTEIVRYDDLNVDSAQGATILYRRLRSAAQRVCAPLEARELSRRRVWQSCVDTALSSAVGHINRPMLTALHEGAANHSNAG